MPQRPPSPPPHTYADVFGMTVQQLTPPNANLLGLEGGVQVVEVAPDSEAARAGIVRNDIISTVNRVGTLRPIRENPGDADRPGAQQWRLQAPGDSAPEGHRPYCVPIAAGGQR